MLSKTNNKNIFMDKQNVNCSSLQIFPLVCLSLIDFEQVNSSWEKVIVITIQQFHVQSQKWKY